MKRCLAVILCLALLPAAAAFAQQANDPATKEDVQKLFEVTHSRGQFAAVIDVMKRQLPALTKSVMEKQLPNATPEQIARMNAFANEMMAKMFQNMPYGELMQAMVPAYQHHFTHGEIQELIRFDSSPLGQKFIAQMPAIMAEYMQAATPVMQKWMQGYLEDMKASAEEYAKKLKECNPAKECDPANDPAKEVKTPPASLMQPLR